LIRRFKFKLGPPLAIGDYDTKVEAVTQGFEIKGKDVICSVCQVSAL